jgi:predicted peptidase
MQTSIVSSPEYPSTPGTYHLTTRGVADSTINYTLHIPTGYDGHRALPVILCLHFGGEATAFYGGLFLEMIPKPGLEGLHAILVAPTIHQGGWTTPRGEATAQEVLAEVERFLRIDTNRRVVMGYSLGGIGAWHFAAKFRDQFVAAIPIAGTPGQMDLEALRSFPLYVIHSRADQVIPISGDAEAVARLKAMGAPVKFAALSSGGHFDYRPVIAELRKASSWVKKVWQQL